MQNRGAPFQISDLEDLAEVFLLPFPLYFPARPLCLGAQQSPHKTQTKGQAKLDTESTSQMAPAFLGKYVCEVGWGGAGDRTAKAVLLQVPGL